MLKYTSRFIMVFLLFSFGFLYAQENWPQWRGPNQNGISEAKDLPTSWSLTKNIAWKTELPSWSAATPIIWGDKIFVTSPSKGTPKKQELQQSQQNQNLRRRPSRDPGGEELFLICVSKTDGKILWQQLLDTGNQIHREQNDVSPSAVTDGKNVWIVTGTGMVTSFDMNGKKIWQKNLQKDYGKFGLNWGFASSPLLFNRSLVIEVLHGYRTDDPSYVISYEARTGNLQWRQERPTDAERESPDAYTTPVAVNHNNRTDIIISGGDYVTGHDPKTGKEIWRAAGLNPLKRANYRIVGTPIFADGIIYAPTRKKPLLALKAGGTGNITESHLIWKWEGGGAPDVPSQLCDGKYFYMVDDKGLVSCLDAKKGTLIWGPESTAEGIVRPSPVLADGKIYILNRNGVTTVIKAGPKFEIISLNELDGSWTLASPAISGKQIFIRTGTHLYCIGE